MRLSCQLQELREAVGAAARVAASAEDPVYIALNAADSVLAITGEGPAQRINTEVTAEIRDEGSVLVPGRTLEGILAGVTDESVQLGPASRTGIEIRSGLHQTHLRTYEPSTIHRWPNTAFTRVAACGLSDLVAGIARTAFVATNEETITVLGGGVLIELNDGYLRIVGMDRIRLAIARVSTRTASEASGYRVVVPVRTLLEVQRIHQHAADQTIDIESGGTEVRFVTTTLELRSRTIATPIPEYEGLIPATSVLSAHFNRCELLAALSIASIVAVDDPRSVRLDFDPTRRECVLTTRSAHIGTQRSRVAATIVGEPVSVELGVRRFMDGVRVSEAVELSMSLTEPPLQRCVLQTGPTERDVYVMTVVA